MSTDKRTVTTDALETLGMIHTRIEHRDAIHLAVEPVTAGEILMPGDDIGIDFDGKAYKERTSIKPLGIVDPFLRSPVIAGERFWLVVYPRVVTSLRHVWSHPDFADETATPLPEHQVQAIANLVDDPYHKAKAWMDNYLEELNDQIDEDDGSPITMEELMDVADSRATSSTSWGGDYIMRGGAFEGTGTPDEFWDHYEVLKDTKVEPDNRNNFFSCSC